jgi:hypothetical protein
VAARKKPHWDAGRLDDLLSGKPHVVPEHLRKLSDKVTPGHSTTPHAPLKENAQLPDEPADKS